ncbi:hypothetical protein [Cohnella faecalis]
MLAGGRRPAAFASVGRLKAEEEALAIMERRIPAARLIWRISSDQTAIGSSSIH